MKRNLIFLIALLIALAVPHNTFASNGKVGGSKTYPAFQAGVTGAWVRIEPGQKMIVERVDPGSPAAERLKVGDQVLKANGRQIDAADPRVPLGTAITEAEASTGAVTLSINRAGKAFDVAIKVPVLGRYASAWPTQCVKSDKIIQANANHLAQR